MESNKMSQLQLPKKIKQLANEKESLLNELGIKMRKKVYRLNGKLAFVVDHPNISLEITNAEYLGEADMDEATWQQLNIDSKTKKIEMKMEGNKIRSFKIVPEEDNEVETPGVS